MIDVQTEIDWKAAERLAEVLGLHTRELVARGDVEEIIKWALQNERANQGPRAASYHELAVLVGYPLPEPEPEPSEEDDGDEREEVDDDD